MDPTAQLYLATGISVALGILAGGACAYLGMLGIAAITRARKGD